MELILLEYLKKHKFKKAINLLINNKCVIDKVSPSELINRSLNINTVYQFDKQRREHRNQLCKLLGELFLESELKNETNELKSRLRIITVSEELFDDILLTNNSSLIRSKDPVQQCWAHIYLTINQIHYFLKEASKAAEERVLTGNYTLSSEMRITLENGQTINLDSAIEDLITSLGMNLKMLAREHALMQKSHTYIPFQPTSEEKHTFESGDTQYTAIVWSELTKALHRCLLFGGEVIENKPTPLSTTGQLDSYQYFSHTESKYELFDCISNLRLNDKIATDTYKVNQLSEVDKAILINNNNFISQNELVAFITLSDIFNSDLLNDTAKYSGLTLREWIKGYSFLKLEFDDFKCVNIPIQTIVTKLTQVGLTKFSALKFISRIMFRHQVKDLFDCPIIRTGSNTVFIFTPALLALDISKTILSRFSSLGTDVSNKGSHFEKECVNLFNDHSKYGLDCKSFKFNIEGEYQYDAVVVWDNKIFLFECKNTVPSGFNPIPAANNKILIDKTVEQLKRLQFGLLKHSKEFESVFDKKLTDFEIIPVILFCLPFSWIGKYKGVYITDYSALAKFFMTGKIEKKQLKSGGSIVIKEHKLWKEETPTAIDLINQFENPLQVKRFISYRFTSETIYRTSDKKGFIKLRYQNDVEKMNQQ